MSALTSLLARDSVVPIRTIEEAIQRQVISGGDLPTVLLEIDALPENVLASYLAAQFGLSPAGREEVMEIPAHLLANIPSEVAIEHRLLPIGEAGERLVVASAAPLPRDRRRELAFVLGRAIENRIAVDIRITAGLEKHYGETASRREQRILRKIGERAPGELREVAPLDPNRAVRPEGDDEARPEARGGAPTRYLNDASKTQKASDAQPSNAAWGKPAGQSIASIRPDAAPTNEPEPTRAALSRPSSPLVDRHRGPLTARDAVSMLGDAETRDDILAVSMAFVRQFFDCTALFVVHDEEAEGLDAHGEGPTWKELQRISVPLDREGAFGAVKAQNAPRVASLGGTDADDAFLADSGRGHAQPAIVAPVAIRQRVILMIYADRGGESFELSDVPEVIGFLPRISDAIQRLILKRKALAGKPGQRAPRADQGFAQKASDAPGDWAVAREPSPASEPSEGRRRKPSYAAVSPPEEAPASPRPEAFDLLGVPREAPPPPAAEDAKRARRTVDTSYRSAGGSVEVVETSRIAHTPGRPASASRPDARPDASREWSASDARREDDSASIAVDVVSLPDPRPPSSVPPRLRVPEREMPSVIVEASADVEGVVARLVRANAEQADELVSYLLERGDEALPALVDSFPGELWVLRSAGPLPRAREVSGVARALSAFGSVAAPYVAPLLGRPRADERYFALSVARDVFTPELARAIATLIFDDDRELRRHAAELLRALDPESQARRDVLDELVARASAPREPEALRVHAIAALGSFADASLVPSLIALSSDASPSVQGAASASLVQITAEDFGAESERWSAWYEANRHRHRVQWLIDGLMHDSESVRRVAGAELQRITREYYGYHPVLSKREREIIQKRYLTWWEATGRAMFTRS